MRVTGSGLSRLKKCQFFGRDDVQWIESAPGAAADFGTEVHGIIAAPFLGIATKGNQRSRAVAEAFMAWFRAELGDSLDGWLAEPAYVIDVANGTARFLGCNIAREYGERAQPEYAMSADLVRVDGDTAIVIDVKTGRRENVDPAETNAQLASIGVALRRLHGVSRVRGILAFATGFGVSIDEVTLDALDLDAHEQELHDLARATPNAQPNPGKHCQYCPAAATCPATTGALMQLADKPRRLPIVGVASAIESMDHARYQYLTLRAAKAAIDQAWEAVRVYADQNDGIDLGDGRRYVKVEKTRETIELEGPAHVEAMRGVLGEDATLAIEVSTTKTAIKDAARAAAKRTGGKIATLERATVEALRAAGAVKTTTSATYEESEPAPKALAG